MKPRNNSDDRLCERLAEDLRLAGKSERTVEAYVGAARRFGKTCRKPLEETTEDDLRAYLADMTRQKVARGTHSIALCGCKFFFQITLGREWNIFDIARPRYDKKLPVVLSREEVWLILVGIETRRAQV